MSLETMLLNADAIIAELNDPQAFWQANQARYLSIAKKITAQTIQLTKPPDIDEDEWQRYTEHLTAAIFSQSIAHGILIGYGGTKEEQRARRGPSSEYQLGQKDILDWVQAGLDGDPNGKDITEIDTNHRRDMDPEAIAAIIYNTIAPQFAGTGSDYAGIKDHIHDFLDARVGTEFQADLATILDAWSTALVPIIELDLSQHIDRQLARL